MAGKLAITTMSTEELETVLDWAAEEGWNPGIADAGAFHTVDPNGFFLARLDDVPVAAISVVNHGSEDAFLGLYICRPEWRGKGIGLTIWNHALEHAGTRSIGLDGVPAQEGNYRASDFVRTGASLRHEGRLPARAMLGVRAATSGDTSALIELDTRACGFARPEFLRAWVSRNDHMRASRVRAQDGRIEGFATWRACRAGTKIGPIITPDSISALELIADIANLRPNGPLIIDVPEANVALCTELEAEGFIVTFATARMYRGRPPTTGPTLQAIATMELG